MTNKNVKYLLYLQLRPCYSLDLVVTKLTNNQNILGFEDSIE